MSSNVFKHEICGRRQLPLQLRLCIKLKMVEGAEMNIMYKVLFICFLAIVSGSFNALPAQWFETLPQPLQDSILWSADHEEGSMNDWTLEQFQHAGGGIFNTGGNDVLAVASTNFAHSGNYSALARITNAFQALNGNRAVRLMRWTDSAWDDGGSHFPTTAYYSTWMYFPVTFNPNKYAPWDPGNGGWWNIFQFKADDNNGYSQPMFTLNVDHDDALQTMAFYLYTGYNEPRSYEQANPVRIPVGKWFHVEAKYVVSAKNSGSITIWQDGRKVLDVDNVRTALEPDAEHAIWGIGNYTDHIVGENVDGTATIYFDDAAVSRLPLHQRSRSQSR